MEISISKTKIRVLTSILLKYREDGSLAKSNAVHKETISVLEKQGTEE